MKERYKSFSEFYPFYLSQHQNRVCRNLHFIGTLLFLLMLITGMITGNWFFIGFAPVVGYGFAWIGHFYFEKNRPATFSYPLYSFIGDFVMFKDIMLGKKFPTQDKSSSE